MVSLTTVINEYGRPKVGPKRLNPIQHMGHIKSLMSHEIAFLIALFETI